MTETTSLKKLIVSGTAAELFNENLRSTYQVEIVIHLNNYYQLFLQLFIKQSLRPSLFFTQSELNEAVAPQAAQLGIHFFLIAFTTDR